MNKRCDSLETILFISHKEKHCGVHNYGINIASTIQKSQRYNFVYFECACKEDFIHVVNNVNPSAIIYNYYPSTMPWISRKLIHKFFVPHIGIIHEVTQQVADFADNSLFDYHIAPDPTLILKNPIVFKTGRLIPLYEKGSKKSSQLVTIGSFGFGLQGKGFERLLLAVQKEYDEALVNFHIPFAKFGDRNGKQAFAIGERCRSLLFKPGIKLQLTHDFLTQEDLLSFLSQNTLNAFFYGKYPNRGISSITDYALAVQKPIAITKSNMFRHIMSITPSICVENSSLKNIIAQGIDPLRPLYSEWCEANIIWDYERIVSNILAQNIPKKTHVNTLRLKAVNVVDKIAKKIRPKDIYNSWINHEQDDLSLDRFLAPQKIYSPGLYFSTSTQYNRILDNTAREQYKTATSMLFALAYEVIYRKIPEANVQQAFILDTILAFVHNFSSPKILCVGSYEDTAAMSLKKMGIQIEEIDPVINYDLETFFNKPSTIEKSYDIVFSTSVIEHIIDDEHFIYLISRLLAPNGLGILTFDYNDQYKSGDSIPKENYRFYTQNDLRSRIIPVLDNCLLLDQPMWDCPKPDFTYLGKYTYAFATLVFRKNC
jgi:hypothetical protein